MDPATPKQIAYLSYMGVRNAAALSKDEASDKIERMFEVGDAEYERLEPRRGQWMTDRFILYPELYASEFKQFLDAQLPELLHTYVRGRVVGAPEKLTKAKIRDVVQAITAEDQDWWKGSNWKELFFDRLAQTYPGCCQGRQPARSKKTTVQALSSNASKGSGCLVLIAVPILLVVVYALRRLLA